jgi:hypothetical protein
LEQTKQSSSSSTKKWLIGCGIGCGAILLIVILLVMGGFFFVRNIVEGFKDTDALMDTLIAQHGEIQEYSPDPDGAIKPERLEAFLEAREVMAPARDEIEKSFRILEEGRDEETGDEESRSVFKRIKTGFGMIPQIADFYKSHVQAGSIITYIQLRIIPGWENPFWRARIFRSGVMTKGTGIEIGMTRNQKKCVGI